MSQVQTASADLSDSLPKQWHDQSTQAVSERLATDPKRGLSSGEAQARLERFGPNRLTQQGGTPMWLLFLKEFNQPLIYILLGASVITAFLNEWVDSIVIFGVVLVNAIIGFVQEVKAMRAIEALTQGLSRQATVLRKMFYLFNCRSLRYSVFKLGFFTNPYLLGGVGLMLLLQIGFTYLPFMQAAFGTAAIGWLDWGYLALVGLGIYLVIGVEKAVRRWGEARRQQRKAEA